MKWSKDKRQYCFKNQTAGGCPWGLDCGYAHPHANGVEGDVANPIKQGFVVYRGRAMRPDQAKTMGATEAEIAAGTLDATGIPVGQQEEEEEPEAWQGTQNGGTDPQEDGMP